MLHHYFDKTFLINLNRRPDRLAIASNELANAGIEFERFEAIDGYELNLVPKPYAGYEYHRKHWTPGAIGILRTTVEILKLAKEKGYQSILIFEDDVFFSPDMNLIVKQHMPFLPEDWQLLYLGFQHSMTLLRSNYLHQVYEGWCCHAYAIKNMMYDRLIDLLSLEAKPLDAYYNDIHKENKSYCFYPNIAFQHAGYSNNTNQVEDEKL